MTTLEIIQEHWERKLVEAIEDLLQQNRQQGLPEFMDGVMVMKAGTTFQDEIMQGYEELPAEFRMETSRRDFYAALNSSTTKVLNEFIGPLPPNGL